MIHVAIAGNTGDLGCAIAGLVESSPGMLLMGGIDAPESIAHEMTITGLRRVARLLDGADVLIDVSGGADVMRHAVACVQAGCALVAGARGLDPNHIAELRDYACRVPIFYSPNLCMETAAVLSLLPALVESVPHLSLEVTGLDHQRRRRDAGPHDVTTLADPTIFLVGADQEIMLSQRVFSPDAHARGALAAARLVANRERGFFTMEDLIRQSSTESCPPMTARVS